MPGVFSRGTQGRGKGMIFEIPGILYHFILLVGHASHGPSDLLKVMQLMLSK